MNKRKSLESLLPFIKDELNNNHEAAVIEMLKVFTNYDSGNALAWFLYGESLRVIGRFNDSLSALTQALDLKNDSNMVEIKISLAQAYMDSGNHEEAEKWFSKVVRDAECSKSGWLWVLRGSNLLTLNHFEQAENCFRKSLDLDDVDLDEAYLNLGYSLRAQSKYDAARAAFMNALEIQPNCPKAKNGLTSIDNIDVALEKIKD